NGVPTRSPRRIRRPVPPAGRGSPHLPRSSAERVVRPPVRAGDRNGSLFEATNGQRGLARYVAGADAGRRPARRNPQNIAAPPTRGPPHTTATPSPPPPPPEPMATTVAPIPTHNVPTVRSRSSGRPRMRDADHTMPPTRAT